MVNIEEENLHVFWKSNGMKISMKFSGMDFDSNKPESGLNNDIVIAKMFNLVQYVLSFFDRKNSFMKLTSKHC